MKCHLTSKDTLLSRLTKVTPKAFKTDTQKNQFSQKINFLVDSSLKLISL